MNRRNDQLPLNTVVVIPNWVGDTVMALPVLEALAGSGRTLHALAKPHLNSILELTPSVSTILTRETQDPKTVEHLRQGNFDEAVVLPNSFRSAWLPYRAAIPYRWGYQGSLRGVLLNPAVPAPHRKTRHQTADYAELLTAMDIPSPPDYTPHLALSTERQQAGRVRLERAGIAAGERPLIGLFPGAEFGPSKRWPMKRFAGLAQEIRKMIPSARQIILAGPREIWLGVRVYEESGKIHPVIGPDLDLAGLAAVLSQLDLLITNDSGPMHLAAALGVPCVALFGPTNPTRTAPSGPSHQVLYNDRWCSPCFRRRCPLIHHRCLRDFDVEHVLQAARSVLEG